MNKNTVWALTLSTVVILLWWAFIQGPAEKRAARMAANRPAPAAQAPATSQPTPQSVPSQLVQPSAAVTGTVAELETVVETPAYKAVFTTRGAAVKHWYLKEKNGQLIDLVLTQSGPVMANFPGSDYRVEQPEPRTLVFTHVSPLGWQAKKTYTLSDQYLHNVSIEIAPVKPDAQLPVVDLSWGPGLGTDAREMKENISQMRVLGFPLAAPLKIEKYKDGEHAAGGLRWSALDNRYFLAAFIPENPAQFATVTASRDNKKQPYTLVLTAAKPQQVQAQRYDVRMYLGPKGHAHLKSLHLNLEETIDFGFFGFLGKIALAVLLAIHKIVGNYGWAIIILTVLLQILVLPLSLKSFKSAAEMKRVQPLIKELQDKYKGDPKRLNVEMLNLYKVHKVNPLGGCLPMLLQLPIFWALFTTLRNAYELRHAPWIMWVKDLSAPDTLMYIGSIPLNILPLIMGVGMFFQQQMMSATTDPAQKNIMYLMPVIFTFMFWGFPSGLVLYWLTNSLMAMIEQYFVIHKPSKQNIAIH